MTAKTGTTPKAQEQPTPANAESVHDFEVTDIDGRAVDLSRFAGKVLLVVNTASKCGFTPQYEEFEALHQAYAPQGFAVLGFPANNFGNQEPGTDEQIKAFCTERFDVTFPMFSKISVKGADKAPLYVFLTESDPRFAGEITWNFNKFLIGPDGHILARYPSKTKPMGPEITAAVRDALAGR